MYKIEFDISYYQLFPIKNVEILKIMRNIFCMTINRIYVMLVMSDIYKKDDVQTYYIYVEDTG